MPFMFVHHVYHHHSDSEVLAVLKRIEAKISGDPALAEKYAALTETVKQQSDVLRDSNKKVTDKIAEHGGGTIPGTP